VRVRKEKKWRRLTSDLLAGNPSRGSLAPLGIQSQGSTAAGPPSRPVGQLDKAGPAGIPATCSPGQWASSGAPGCKRSPSELTSGSAGWRKGPAFEPPSWAQSRTEVGEGPPDGDLPPAAAGGETNSGPGSSLPLGATTLAGEGARGEETGRPARRGPARGAGNAAPAPDTSRRLPAAGTEVDHPRRTWIPGARERKQIGALA
jgi:hypothetical protein